MKNLKNLTVGLRWIAVFPVAVAAHWLAWWVSTLIANITSFGYLDLQSFSFKVYRETIASMAMGGAFIYVGARIAPSYKKNTAYVLSVIGFFATGLMLVPAFMDGSGLAIWAGLCCIAGIGSMIYSIHTDEITLKDKKYINGDTKKQILGGAFLGVAGLAGLIAGFNFNFHHRDGEPRQPQTHDIADAQTMSVKERQLLTLKAEQGNANAQIRLADMYYQGNGVPKDDAEAIKWYRKSAEQGNALGQTNLGIAYHDGHGVPQDDTEAYKWFHKAAEQGEALAQSSLGMAYYSGIGIPQDYAEAMKWFHAAAEQGNTLGQLGLCAAYYNGPAISQNYEEAYAWCSVAVAQGNNDAVRGRDGAAKQLNPTDLSKAQQLAKKYLADYTKKPSIIAPQSR